MLNENLQKIFEEERRKLRLERIPINVEIHRATKRDDFIDRYTHEYFEKLFKQTNLKERIDNGLLSEKECNGLLSKLKRELNRKYLFLCLDECSYTSYEDNKYNISINEYYTSKPEDFRKTCRHELFHIAAGHAKYIKKHKILRNLAFQILYEWLAVTYDQFGLKMGVYNP
ncbi:hypothetical protein HZA33_03515 [Candidatus Pacearchaeota archaeon]|nr:hypothetical protein [Candidatus Pacearchaeota archaeon]